MEPTPQESADGSILVKVLAAVLERLVNSNKSTARLDGGQLTKFHALKAPGIGVEAYLDRYVFDSDVSLCRPLFVVNLFSFFSDRMLFPLLIEGFTNMHLARMNASS